jgi:HEAT repeat protein
LARLAGGDRRSIGESDAVVATVLTTGTGVSEIIEGLDSADPVIRMRCGDVLEKLSRRNPGCLLPHRARLLALAKTTAEQELRWHLAQMLPRLPMTARQRRDVAAVLQRYLTDPSRIVRVSALQATVDLAGDDARLRAMAAVQVKAALSAGSPSEKARARKLVRITESWPEAALVMPP